MSKTTEAMKQAQHLLRWTHFGECRTYQGPVPEAREVDKLLSEAIATEEAQWVEPVARVKRLTNCSIIDSTGCAVSWEDLPDGSALFTRPAPSPADHIGDATKLAGERAALIAQLSNDDADMLRRKWFGHRNTGHLSFVEAVDATMEGLMAQQVAVPQGWKPMPTEPTKAMWKAAGDAVVTLQQTSTLHHDKISDAVYRAMLAATPKPPQADALAADHAEDVRVMVPMTDMEVHELWWAREKENPGSSHLPFARAIERHHKIGVKP